MKSKQLWISKSNIRDNIQRFVDIGGIVDQRFVDIGGIVDHHFIDIGGIVDYHFGKILHLYLG
jgi:hypothetical protein